MIIKEIKAKKIKNSRNEDSIEVSVRSNLGKKKASAPSGKSRGKFEKEYYKGSVSSVIKKINSFEKLDNLEIKKYDDLKKVENVFDFGSNPNVALEYSILKSLKFSFGYKKVAIPLGNVIGGGMHSKGNKKPDFQEFLVYVEHCNDFSKRVKINKMVYDYLRKVIKSRDKSFKGERNDEGAWKTNLSNVEILEILKDVTELLSNKLGHSIRIGLDVAASSFFKNGKYQYKNYSFNKKEASLSKKEQIDFLAHLVKRYNIGYLEDPLNQEDFDGFKELRKKVGSCLVVGDDLTVTNFSRVKRAKGSVSGVIIKPNQIGSLIEVKKVVEYCKLNNLKLIFSHRSGETKDDFLSDLCYMFGGDFLKAGVYGKERVVKYNRLSKISRGSR
jgi:enolase